MNTTHNDNAMPSVTVDAVLEKWKEGWSEEGKNVSDATMAAARAVMIRTVPAGADQETAENILDTVLSEGLTADEAWVIQAAKECGLYLFSVETGTPTWPQEWTDTYTRLKTALPDGNMTDLRSISRLYVDLVAEKGALGARQEFFTRQRDGLFPDSWNRTAAGRGGAELADIMAG